ncbi:TetR/AcrR family transcriptional regulator [Skermania sp. ID1734]|uniref:TetR/AcrR family transcriptional regulator n=1 Tax=Skermania sp. ID1734 TaxID=2597516 RepID=UPI00117C97F0|nr:TetR/AcrR family transcriptional regulator [Skermania sp. ID1734]TSD99725.1 TetR/AcrR family transcriptional regulator [Skermania sp. ID1734]
MANPGPGRPRLEQQRRPGTTPRAEILDAAAELFSEHGYANTSTRRIADAVGMRQASLYHHFATKDDILDALLSETIAEPLELAGRLVGDTEAPEIRLYALAQFDVAQLCASHWNLAALYLLPEVRTTRFAAFRQRREELRGHYASLARDVVAACDGVADAITLPFRLVETVVNIRSDDGMAPSDAERTIAEAALRVLGWSGDFADVRRGANAVIGRLAR